MTKEVISGHYRLMDRVLARLKWQMCLVYLDDVLVFGKSFEEHQERLDCVLKALEKAGLTLNFSKCIFATNIIFHLGHIIDEKGIRPDPAKISSLVNFKVNNIKSLREFLGLASFYRRFVPGICVVGASITRLVEEKRRLEMDWCSLIRQGEAREHIGIITCAGPLR